jgi:AhpD family alkylhydroperoxidase
LSRYDLKKFAKERERLNETVMEYSSVNTKRFFSLDWQVYNDGALTKKTKELMGLVVSLALRCDDCIQYHLLQCKSCEVTDEELEETVAVALAAAGSITIPCIRRLWAAWDELKREDRDG